MSSLVLLINKVLQAVQILDLRPKHLRVKINVRQVSHDRDNQSENQLKINMQTMTTSEDQ